MTPEELKLRVDEIIAAKGDPEGSHVLEDNLTEDLVTIFCPEWVFSELDRIAAANLTRWYV